MKESNRSFGLVFFIFFILIAIYPVFNGNEIKIYFVIISLIFLVLGLINSAILSPLNKIWLKFGLLLGKIVSPIVMGIIFFLVVTPIGILMRILGKDILNLSYNKKKSYWIKRYSSKSKMKNQF